MQSAMLHEPKVQYMYGFAKKDNVDKHWKDKMSIIQDPIKLS